MMDVLGLGFQLILARSEELKVGDPLAVHCGKYVAGLRLDLSSFENYLGVYRAAVEVSAKAHSNAHQEVNRDGMAAYHTEPPGDQLYNGNRYTTHLVEVEGVLRRFGFRPTQSRDARILKIAARLHDTPEDTPISSEEILYWFGAEILGPVEAVKKIKPGAGLTPERAKLLTYLKVRSHRLGTPLKLADRIANVERGIRSGQILQKYIDDYDLFRELLYVSGEYETMWAYLDFLIQNKRFPGSNDYWSQRLEGLKYEVRDRLDGSVEALAGVKVSSEARPISVVMADQSASLEIRDIHFMHSFVDELMGNQKYSVVETAHDLRQEELSVETIAPLEVWQDERGKIWTLDGRRLAAIFLAGNIKSVPVVWISQERLVQALVPFNPWRNGESVQILLDDGRVIVPKRAEDSR